MKAQAVRHRTTVDFPMEKRIDFATLLKAWVKENGLTWNHVIGWTWEHEFRGYRVDFEGHHTFGD